MFENSVTAWDGHDLNDGRESMIYSVTFFKDGWRFLQSLEDLVLSENVSVRSSSFYYFSKRLEGQPNLGKGSKSSKD